MLKPLVKYTGGKFTEFKNFQEFIPRKIRNYFEPFVGGGGVLFQIKNSQKYKEDGKRIFVEGNYYINDFSKNLIDFYNIVTDDNFYLELEKISNNWDRFRELVHYFSMTFRDKFHSIMCLRLNEEFLSENVIWFIEQITEKIDLDTHGFSLKEHLITSLKSKLITFKNKFEKSEDRVSSQFIENIELASECIETSMCQAFYFLIRDMYNDWNNRGNEGKYTKYEMSAQWYFIREFCFGGMFRFNSDGDFNIPYGGLTYNKKCFSCKLKALKEEEIQDLFSNIKMCCGDFEEAIKNWKFNENDFMYLDPPYLTTFSEYDNNSFNKEDHIRLKECLDRCNCKWMLSINKNEFFEELYSQYNIREYNKTYMYKARGDYETYTKGTHLLITNY